jgi:hypothetical protein
MAARARRNSAATMAELDYPGNEKSIESEKPFSRIYPRFNSDLIFDLISIIPAAETVPVPCATRIASYDG